MIELKNAVKKFDGREVLSGVNMSVPDGATVGLCGISGSGKSTVAKILCGTVRPDGGNAYIDGKPLWGKNYNRKEGIKIQIVSQQPFAVLDPVQRIYGGFKELIKYHRLAENGDIDGMIGRAVEGAELDREILNRRPNQISGGEAQRIAIAKALLFKPGLLILDEATSMLDVSTQANVLSAVKREVGKFGGSILFISHDIGLVDLYCAERYTLDNGKFALRG